jgi:hypothetical protein
VIKQQDKHLATYGVPINELGQHGKITLPGDNHRRTQSVCFVAEVVKLSRGRLLGRVMRRAGRICEVKMEDGAPSRNRPDSAGGGDSAGEAGLGKRR